MGVRLEVLALPRVTLTVLPQVAIIDLARRARC